MAQPPGDERKLQEPSSELFLSGIRYLLCSDQN
jgi:hypothetical protein